MTIFPPEHTVNPTGDLMPSCAPTPDQLYFTLILTSQALSHVSTLLHSNYIVGLINLPEVVTSRNKHTDVLL